MPLKTADQLGISEQWRCALIKTLAAMQEGRLFHVSTQNIAGKVKPDTPASQEANFGGGFNMGLWRVGTHHCGTIACIGGTAEMLGNCQITGNTLPKNLDNLFCPSEITDWNRITPQQATRALSNYLETGSANWHKAMETKR